ncbi:MAG: PucC family protein, partial [Sandaracinaceae bacterium]|nr:PucC family protein [Sandaracinaceae bacterium]
PWVIALLALGIGVGTAAYMTASWALVTDLAPPEGAARFLGVANVAIAGSSALARLPAGAAIDAINAWAGDRQTGYYAVYSVSAIMLVSSAIVAVRLPGRVPVRSRAPAP